MTFGSASGNMIMILCTPCYCLFLHGANSRPKMADWKAQLDAELANLRDKESALKKSGKTGELKALAKRKGELKLMKKKGISPVIAPTRQGHLQSWSTGMPSMPTSVPRVPKWVSEFPNFTPPSEDDAAEFAGGTVVD